MITAKRAKLLCSALSMASLAGCGSSSLFPTAQPEIVPDVYVAGFQLNTAGTARIAMLWKNGVATALTDGTQDAVANSVTASGSDVYVTGNVTTSNSSGAAVLWENGVPTYLYNGPYVAYAGQVAVSGSDIYVAGGWSGEDIQNNYYSSAGYWKNGVFIALLTATAQGRYGSGATGAMAVQGSNVYVGGIEDEYILTGPGTASFMQAAIVWKNGTPTALTDGLTPAAVFTLAINGSDVYAAGSHCFSLANNCLNATYWKNGVETVLSSAPASVLTGIAVANGNVYASGNTSVSAGVDAQYWTDAMPATLYESAQAAANGITTYNGDVYVVGAQLGGACYWKNGKLQSVTTGQFASSGNAIAVAAP